LLQCSILIFCVIWDMVWNIVKALINWFKA
jgi:hypothetical protein